MTTHACRYCGRAITLPRGITREQARAIDITCIRCMHDIPATENLREDIAEKMQEAAEASPEWRERTNREWAAAEAGQIEDDELEADIASGGAER